MSSSPIFVDDSGRRHRLVRLVGWIVAAVVAAYLALLGISLIGSPGLVPLSLPAVGRLLPDAAAPKIGTVRDVRSNPGDVVATSSPAAGAVRGTGGTTTGGAGIIGGHGSTTTATQPSASPSASPRPTTRPSARPTPRPSVTPTPTASPTPTKSPRANPSPHGSPRPTHSAHPTPHKARPTPTPTATP